MVSLWSSLLRLVFVLVGTLALSAGAAAPVPKSLATAIKSDRPFILVVAPRHSDATAQSEAYGDWRSHLSEFEQRKSRDIPIVRVTRA